MASSERLASVESWSLHQSFNIDSWLNSDSDLLAKALHQSISTSTIHPRPLSPSNFFDSDLSPPQTLFSSDPEIAGVAKRKRGPQGGRPVKRRSRVSTKRSQTTFIAADAVNFRQMVQHVTGAKFLNSSFNNFSPILKPEPHRLVNRLPPCETLIQSTTLPTLDTSRQVDVGGGSSVDLDTYPTLESWKVM